MWLLGVARAARLWRHCTENRLREESWVHAATVCESADPIQVLYGSCNGESSALSLLSVACVSHELHAQKIHGPRWIILWINEQTGSELSTAFFSPARFSLTSWVPTYYTPLVKPIRGLILALFPVGRLFGISQPNTLVCGHGYQSGSFLIWRHYRASKYYAGRSSLNRMLGCACWSSDLAILERHGRAREHHDWRIGAGMPSPSYLESR